MKKWCLITGSSGGIGLDLAYCFARNGYNLILVARNIEKLHKLSANIKEKYSIEIKIINKDLSQINSALELKDEVTKAGLKVHTLVNNAGVGYAGSFFRSDYQKTMQMNILNMISLSNLCHLFFNEMKESGEGQILNVASVAAFQPGPFMSAYFASKSYVLNFTLGLREELAHENISVSCLCPGATKTNFFNNDTFAHSNLNKVPWLSKSKDVAQQGYLGLINNKAIVIPGLINKIMALSVRFTPYWLLTKIVSKINNFEAHS